ncbi:MAG: hypothetical protein ABI678_17535 [Kofleriaceae bacterium]
MRLPTLLACLAVSASVFVACRGGDDDNTPTDGNGSNGSGSFVKIQDVQNDAMAPGTAVALHNVVVTAVDLFGDQKGDIWVEEQGGGKRSGIHVFNAGDQVQSLVVGDVIDLKGAVKSEFALTGSNGDMTGRTTTELEPANGGMITITKSGMNAPITPDHVDALAIGKMYDSTMAATGGGQAFTDAWEDWEGVLIELDNVSAQNSPRGFGAMPYAPDAWSVNLTGVIKLEGTQTDITMSSITRATCFSKTVGVVDYFYDYLLIPRTGEDFGTSGAGCPVAEATCDDGIDNDGNGFLDCGDFGCQTTSPSCATSITIHDIDAAADANPANPTLPTGAVRLTNVCVTARTGNNVYIADSGTAAADGGLYVFGGGNAGLFPAGTAAGSLIDAIGTVTAFKQSTSTAPNPQVELTALGATLNAGTCAPVAASPAMAVSQLIMDANGHKWIGSLVTLTSVNGGKFSVSMANTGTFGKLSQNGTVFSFGNSFASTFHAVATDCFDSLTGIWTYDTFGAGAYELLLTVAPTVVSCT